MTQAVLHTNRGDIALNLFANQAPKTVANFVGLADGSPGVDRPEDRPARQRTALRRRHLPPGDRRLHDPGRLPVGTGTGGPGYRFADEFHPELQFDRPYLLAMANAGPNTNGSQFFITVGKTPHLNFKHSIFGEVADQASRDVVDAIATTPTGRMDKPVDDVVIESVDIIA